MAADDRRRPRDEMRGIREERRVPAGQFQMRGVANGTGGTDLICSGYASVTCANTTDRSHVYKMEDDFGPFEESILRGAFQKTLAEGADVAFLVNHGGLSMARTKPGTLRLSEDDTGLFYEARLNPKRPDVQSLQAAVMDGAVDESSFAFRVMRQKWSYAEENGVIDRRWIQEVNLDHGDVSPVNFGANPHTANLVSMRGLKGGRGLTVAGWGRALREVRAGKTISQATFDTLKPIHDHLLAISGMASQDQPSLAQLLSLDAKASLAEQDSSTVSLVMLESEIKTARVRDEMDLLAAAPRRRSDAVAEARREISRMRRAA